MSEPDLSRVKNYIADAGPQSHKYNLNHFQFLCKVLLKRGMKRKKQLCCTILIALLMIFYSMLVTPALLGGILEDLVPGVLKEPSETMWSFIRNGVEKFLMCILKLLATIGIVPIPDLCIPFQLSLDSCIMIKVAAKIIMAIVFPIVILIITLHTIITFVFTVLLIIAIIAKVNKLALFFGGEVQLSFGFLISSW